jgi:hypothetical protein
MGSVSGRTLEISERGFSATLPVELPIGEVVDLSIRLRIRNYERPRHGQQQERISPRLPIYPTQSRPAHDPGKLLPTGADT